MAAKSNDRESPTGMQLEPLECDPRSIPSTALSFPALAEIADKTEKNQSAEDTSYSIFTRGEKWAIVIITSVAGLFRQAYDCPVAISFV